MFIPAGFLYCCRNLFQSCGRLNRLLLHQFHRGDYQSNIGWEKLVFGGWMWDSKVYQVTCVTAVLLGTQTVRINSPSSWARYLNNGIVSGTVFVGIKTPYWDPCCCRAFARCLE